MFLGQKDYPKAESHFLACLEIAEANQYLKEQSIALGNLGSLAYKQGDLDKAMQFYEKKWLLVDKMDDKAELIKVLGNIANIHRDKGQHREALEYYEKVLTIKQTLGNSKDMAITYSVIADELRELDRLPEALIELDKAIVHATENLFILCEYMHNKAEILSSMKEFEKSFETNQNALKLASEVNKQKIIDSIMQLNDKLISLMQNRNPE